jgi:hypothetical protein
MRSILALLLLLGLNAGARAQTFVGEFGGLCSPMSAMSQLTYTLPAPIPAASLVVVSVALEGSAFSNTFHDSTNPAFNWFSGGGGNQNNMFTVPYSHFVAGGLAAGTVFTYGNIGGANLRACMHVVAFSGMSGKDFIFASGNNQSASPGTTQTATTIIPTPEGDSTQNLVFMEVSTIGDPGTVSTGQGAVTTKQCLGPAPSLCIVSSYRGTATLGAQTQTTSSTNAVTWQTAINELRTDLIDALGFE